jgi:hypothetical protein
MITKLAELNNKIRWETELAILKNKHETTDENDIWKVVGRNNYLDIFKSQERYFQFLLDNYANLDPNTFSSLIVNKFYNFCKSSIQEDEKLFLFFAKAFNIDFHFYESMIEKYPFLVKNPNTIKDTDKKFFDDFWYAVFKSVQVIPEYFIKKYYWYFYNNNYYFYNKVIRHNVFFKLDQSFINKYKSNYPKTVNK